MVPKLPLSAEMLEKKQTAISQEPSDGDTYGGSQIEEFCKNTNINPFLSQSLHPVTLEKSKLLGGRYTPLPFPPSPGIKRSKICRV